jgi:hypothetical protein
MGWALEISHGLGFRNIKPCINEVFEDPAAEM